jgi:hypothetical protein
MAQHREAPAFQEYPASIMARIEYRAMTLEGRGLFITLRYECGLTGSCLVTRRCFPECWDSLSNKWSGR